MKLVGLGQGQQDVRFDFFLDASVDITHTVEAASFACSVKVETGGYIILMALSQPQRD